MGPEGPNTAEGPTPNGMGPILPYNTPQSCWPGVGHTPEHVLYDRPTNQLPAPAYARHLQDVRACHGLRASPGMATVYGHVRIHMRVAEHAHGAWGGLGPRVGIDTSSWIHQ